jgi:hypothetical protein
MNLLKKIFSRNSEQQKPPETPGWVRKPFYEELLNLSEEEIKMQELLELPYPPRLIVVDESHRVLLRPQDRDQIGLDDKMNEAFSDHEQRKKEEVANNTYKTINYD